MALNPLPISGILASRSLSGSPLPPRLARGRVSSMSAFPVLALLQTLLLLGPQNPWGWPVCLSPRLCPTSPLSLPLLFLFSPSLGLWPPSSLCPIPAVTGSTALAPEQSREPDLPPQPWDPHSLVMGSTTSELSVALACSRVLGFHLPDGQTEAPGEKQSDREKQKACSSWPRHLLEPCLPGHPTPGSQSLCAPSHRIPGRLGAARRPQSRRACVKGSSRIPGCLLLPDFIRQKVWEPRAAGRMAVGKCPAPQSRVGGGRPGHEDVGKVHPVVPRWSRR